MKDDPIVNLMIAATPGGIEAQEAAGQRKLVSTFRQLPKDMGPDGLQIAEALGFKLGVEVDELFISVRAPEGWSMDATGHSMHSNILDAEGRQRGSVFYKAAFYDRRADGNWLTRYFTERHYPTKGEFDTFLMRAVDRQTGEVLAASQPMTRPEGSYGEAHRRHYAATEKAAQEMVDALAAAFPDWKNPVAYWSK